MTVAHVRFRLVSIALGVSFAIFLGEVGLRMFPSYTPIAMDIFQTGSDGELRLTPGVRRQHASPEWNVAVDINAQGFRDAEGAPPPGAVLAVGDSMTFGWGVAETEAFPQRLEHTRGTRVANAGIPATGPVDQLGLLKELLPRWHPKTVLLGFWVGNDFQDEAEGGASGKEVVDGLLFTRGTRTASSILVGWVKRRSYVAQLAAQGLWLLQRRRAEVTPVENRASPGLDARNADLRAFVAIHLTGELPGDLAAGVTRTYRDLDAMRELCRENGARFVLVVLPRSVQVHDEDRRRYERAYDIAPGQWDMDRPQRLLAAWANGKSDVELIDTLPALRAAAGSGRLFFFPDSHMNARGHSVVAEEIARRLRP